MSASAFRWYSAQTLKPRLFPEAQCHESCPGFLFPSLLEASVRGPLSLKFSFLSIVWFYHVHKSLYFGFLMWFYYSFDKTAKSLYDLFFRPFCALTFLMLISTFASMSTSLSSFQSLHIPFPILLLSGFWLLASAYFYEFYDFIFLLVQFLVHSLSWLSPIWLVPVVSKQLENSVFFLDNTAFFWYHVNFLWFHFLLHKVCLSQTTVTWVLCVSMLVLLF